MSTKSSIYYDDDSNFHLYQEGLDRWNVYLDVPLSGRGEVTVAIPLHVWKEMRQTTMYVERYLDMSPADLRAEAEEAVAKRLREYEKAPTESLKDLVALSGCFPFGDIANSADEQVEHYIEWYTPEAIKEKPPVQARG